jgi:hypothetical protein
MRMRQRIQIADGLLSRILKIGKREADPIIIVVSRRVRHHPLCIITNQEVIFC